ncbi:unnamed protein product [Nezara viridula]|uniref:Uncharacterized protein n=1 Tax=Nezara viridula TaxID=85310 RepID=A0A9P0MPZ1_NEZVI|nr:unnamed protein product [Nezara viridula]
MSTNFTIYYFFILIYSYTCFGDKTVFSSNCRQALYNIDVPSIDHLSDLVNKFFNKTLKVIQNTDPFSTNHIDLKYSGYGIESEGYLDDLLVSGAASTKLSNIHIDDKESLRFGIDIALKNIQFLSAFSLNFNMLTMLPIIGDGDIGTAMSGLQFSIKTTFKELMDKRIQISDLQFDCSVGDVKVDISRVFNNTYLATYTGQVLSELLPLLLNDFPPLKTYGGIGLMAGLNVLLCDQAVTLQTVVTFMEKFIQ